MDIRPAVDADRASILDLVADAFPGDGRDERFAQIDLQATALSGLAVIVALIVAWLVATARGQSGSPYGWLLAIAGLTYVLAVGWFRWRG